MRYRMWFGETWILQSYVTKSLTLAFSELMEEWNLDYEPLFSFQQLALVSRSHPLAGRTQICAQDLMPYIEVVHGDYQVPALTLAEFPTSLSPTASHNQKSMSMTAAAI